MKITEFFFAAAYTAPMSDVHWQLDVEFFFKENVTPALAIKSNFNFPISYGCMQFVQLNLKK